MSVRLMSLVFDADICDLPYVKDGESRKAKASTVKLILLAYADHANDEGEGAYPGYKRLKRKTKLSGQGIADTLEAVKQNKFMFFDGWSKLDTHAYRINKPLLESLVKPLDTEADDRVKPLDRPLSSHLTPLSQATGLNPSSNHPPQPSSDAGLSEKDLEKANQAVDFILGLEKKVKYPNRDKLAFSEDYLKYADLYVELCGKDADGHYNQVPTKRVLLDWMQTFEEWKQENLKPEHIRAAYEHATRPEGGWPVGRPGSLTNTAVAFKSKGNGKSNNSNSLLDQIMNNLEASHATTD